MRKHAVWMPAVLITLLGCMILAACGQTREKEQEAEYMRITAQEAKTIMDSETGYVILDVRTQEEYDQGHIPGAVLIPNTEIETRAAQELPDKDQLILVYCRSGNRSKQAADRLVKLGYTQIREFGGILDWPYDIEK